MCRTQSSETSQPAKATSNLADLPSYQFFPALSAVFSDPDAPPRGLFQRIQADKIYLPTNRLPPDPEKSQLWINRLPAQIRPNFADETNPFRASVTEHLKTAKRDRSLPQAHLYASKKEYAALLAKAEAAGMLHWSVVSTEDSQYSNIASDIQMTLFAVSKSHDRSRLISWPRVQNEAMPQPSYTSLPHPSMLEAIRVHGSTPGAFFLDISNMFHNITLPLWLSRLLPMQPIPFSHFPTDTQGRIAKRTRIPTEATEVLVRPFQATMPMGFKWAVFIAHTFVSSCFEESFQLLKSSGLALPGMHLSKLRAADAPFISKRTPPLLHIIDDAAVVAVDWPDALLTAWHKITRNLLRFNNLPVADSKSSLPSTVVRDSVSFVGCNWNLKQGIIEPMPNKINRITACVKSLLDAETCTLQDWERVVGKLLWFATLNRPLLACINSLFYADKAPFPTFPTTKPQGSRRELRTLAALLPLARVDVNLPLCPIMVAFDASKTAGAVTYTYAPPDLATKLWNAAQKARFSAELANHEQLREVTAVVKACTWKLAFVHSWNKDEHINCLKAATAVLAAEWLTRFRMSNIRAILLTNSLVTLDALQKGRSSKTGMLLICRRFATIVLAHDIRAVFA